MAETPTPAIGNPMDALTEVSTRLEQHRQALRILSDDLHRPFDGDFGEVPKPLSAWLYDRWLLLEILQRDFVATDALFAAADTALNAAAIPAMFDDAGQLKVPVPTS